MQPVIKLYCPLKFSYVGVNSVQAYLGATNVSEALISLWAAYRKAVGELPDQGDMYGYGREGEFIAVPGGESFTLDDLAAVFEELVKFKVEACDGQSYGGRV